MLKTTTPRGFGHPLAGPTPCSPPAVCALGHPETPSPWGVSMVPRILKPVLPLAAKWHIAAVAHFRIWAVGGRWRLPGPMSADVRHMARPSGPLRSPPALRVPWGHAPPIWRPGGPRRRPHHARFGRWLGRRAWSAAARVVTYGCCATYPRARGGYGRSLRPLGALWVAGGDSGCASLV